MLALTAVIAVFVCPGGAQRAYPASVPATFPVGPQPAAPAKPPKAKAKGRAGAKTAQDEAARREFEKQHPRAAKGRVGAGSWIEKGQGMEGTPDTRVQQLQNRLASLGYNVKADGRFGPATDSAIRAFQRRNGLTVDGKVGESTTEALKTAQPGSTRSTAAANAPATGQGTYQPTAAPAAGGYGAKYAGNSPEARQARGDQNEALAGTRDVGEKTKGEKAAARERKKERTKRERDRDRVSRRRERDGDDSEVEDDGTVSDGGSIEDGDTRRSRSRSSRHATDTIALGLGMDRARGDNRVKELQQMLDDIGLNLGDGGIDGKFGPDTRKALLRFQRKYGLKADGILGKKTRTALNTVQKLMNARDKRAPGDSLRELAQDRAVVRNALLEAAPPKRDAEGQFATVSASKRGERPKAKRKAKPKPKPSLRAIKGRELAWAQTLAAAEWEQDEAMLARFGRLTGLRKRSEQLKFVADQATKRLRGTFGDRLVIENPDDRRVQRQLEALSLIPSGALAQIGAAGTSLKIGLKPITTYPEMAQWQDAHVYNGKSYASTAAVYELASKSMLINASIDVPIASLHEMGHAFSKLVAGVEDEPEFDALWRAHAPAEKDPHLYDEARPEHARAEYAAQMLGLAWARSWGVPKPVSDYFVRRGWAIPRNPKHDQDRWVSEMALSEADTKADLPRGGEKSKHEGMKRCPSCNWRNKKGHTKCAKCSADLAKKGDAKLSEDAPYPIAVGDPVRASNGDLSLGRSGVVIGEAVAGDGAWVYHVRWEDGSVQNGVRQFALRNTRALSEDAWGGKPGTNHLQVGPHARKKLSPLIRHYMKDPHPFTSCVRDNTKRFGPERAKRVCAVVKDLGKGTTKWRKGPGGKKLSEADIVRLLVDDIVEAGLETVGDVDLVEAWLREQLPEGVEL